MLESAWKLALPPSVMFAVALWGIGAASFWRDEAATLSAVRRSLPQLWRMLGHTDVVHGAYYLLMWVLVRALGTTESAARPVGTHAARWPRSASVSQDHSSTVLPLPAGADIIVNRAGPPSRPNSPGRATTPPVPGPATRPATASTWPDPTAAIISPACGSPKAVGGGAAGPGRARPPPETPAAALPGDDHGRVVARGVL